MTVLLAFAAAFLFATGTWLLLQRRLSRILIGIGLVGHGSNILLLTSGGPSGVAPIIGSAPAVDFPTRFLKPLP
jgi:multicomponent Na+:H+ antiporter subunit C